MVTPFFDDTMDDRREGGFFQNLFNDPWGAQTLRKENADIKAKRIDAEQASREAKIARLKSKKAASISDAYEKGGELIQGNPTGVDFLSQDHAPDSYFRLREVASPVITEKVKAGTLTKEDYLKRSIEAKNIERQSLGEPPLSNEEAAAHAQKEGSFWDKVGIDGKTALFLGASLLGAHVARKDGGRYNKAWLNSYNASQENKARALEAQKERDFRSAQEGLRYKEMLDADQRRFAQQEKMAQMQDEQQNARLDKSLASQERIAKEYADARVESAVERARADVDKQLDKSKYFTPQQLDTTVDSALQGAGFNKFADKKGKTLDPAFAEAKAGMLSLFNAYRNSPKYQGYSDGQIMQAIIKMNISKGTPASGGFLGIGGTKEVPAKFTPPQ